MKALKLLVISMGLLIAIGLGFVGYGLSRKTPHPAAATPIPGTAEVSGPITPFALQYPVPKGYKLEQVLAAGDRVVLRYSCPDGDRLLFIDSHTGQLAGTILLPPDTSSK
jgi:hypothetical protein